MPRQPLWAPVGSQHLYGSGEVRNQAIHGLGHGGMIDSRAANRGKLRFADMDVAHDRCMPVHCCRRIFLVDEHGSGIPLHADTRMRHRLGNACREINVGHEVGAVDHGVGFEAEDHAVMHGEVARTPEKIDRLVQSLTVTACSPEAVPG